MEYFNPIFKNVFAVEVYSKKRTGYDKEILAEGIIFFSVKISGCENFINKESKEDNF